MNPVVSTKRLATGLLLVGLANLALGGAENSSLKYFGAPPGTLARVKARVKAGDKTLTPALDALIADADHALLADPPSVMDKTRLPPTGDRHDYMSTAPYFWPDPARSNGLPYIRHDGKVNPESRGPASDHDRLGRMGATVQTLALAYYLTGREAYATQAARFLRVWFLKPATRMKPNMDFAQGVPGASTGRGFGVLEGRSIAEAADAAQLLAGSGAWKAEDDKAFRSWLGVFLDWLLTSRNGRAEAAAHNNHGTFYDVQVLRLALVLGRDSLAKSIASAAGPKRIAAQIEPDGRQPLELQRTAALGYSAFNLQALFTLATLAEYAGTDLWHYQTSDGRSLRKALDFLLPYIDVPAKPWPYPQLKKYDPANLAPLLRQAANVFHESEHERLLAKYPDTTRKRFQLLSPKSEARAGSHGP